jgi:hypothetical protein
MNIRSKKKRNKVKETSKGSNEEEYIKRQVNKQNQQRR